ncbi:MAG TPA: hypothetical protein VK909_23285, partial [Anaerolineales bacterium]|nr:hypothetical protein [Anaerolineales bacterium]
SNDPDDLACQVLKLLYDFELSKRLSESAAERAFSKFTWHEAQKKLLKVYERLLARGGETKHQVGYSRQLLRTSQCSYPLEQFIDVERLCDVIICSRAHRSVLCPGIVFRANNQNWQRRKPWILTQLFTETEPRYAWHHQVYRDQIRLEGSGDIKSFCAVVDDAWLVTFHDQERLHQFSNREIIVDNEYFEHGSSSAEKIGLRCHPVIHDNA